MLSVILILLHPVFGWSPRPAPCFHLDPTSSRRVRSAELPALPRQPAAAGRPLFGSSTQLSSSPSDGDGEGREDFETRERRAEAARRIISDAEMAGDDDPNEYMAPEEMLRYIAEFGTPIDLNTGEGLPEIDMEAVNAELRMRREGEEARKIRKADKAKAKGAERGIEGGSGSGGGGSEWRAKKVFGDMNGLDDPRGVAWRRKAESVIRETVDGLKASGSMPGVQVYDITWNIGDLQVQLERHEGVGLDELVAVNAAIVAALEPFDDELRILERHELEVTTRGAPDVLTAEREFKAFKGFDVVVELKMPEGIEDRDPIEGKLVGRDVHETIVSVKGRDVHIPNYFVAAVKLPPALEEEGVGPREPGREKAGRRK